LTQDDLGRIAVAVVRSQDKVSGSTGESFDRCEVRAEMLTDPCAEKVNFLIV